MTRPLARLEAAEPLPMRPAIRIRDLRKVFGQLIAIDGVSLDIAPGEFFMIVGPSGCGKTTLLRILAGLDSVTSGAIEIETPHSQRPVNSMIFQGDSIFPWMTVWDNAAYGLKMRRVPAATIKEVVGHYLARTGLTLDQLTAVKPACPTGADIAQAVRVGRADCGVATRAVAQAAGLGFVPLTWERFDLALRQRNYFLPGAQALFTFLRTAAFRERADELGGYDVSEAGRVRWVN